MKRRKERRGEIAEKRGKERRGEEKRREEKRREEKEQGGKSFKKE